MFLPSWLEQKLLHKYPGGPYECEEPTLSDDGR